MSNAAKQAHSGNDATPPLVPFVEGQLVAHNGLGYFAGTNPSTGAQSFSIAESTAEDISQAIASARRAFDDGRWSRSAPSIRKVVLHRFADLLSEHAAEFDRMDAAEMGKPVSVAFCNAASASGLLRFNAEAVDKIVGDVYPTDKGAVAIQYRMPRGVVAAVVPWNFPTFNALLKVAPALAAGNSVVLKPSELSTSSAIRLAEIAIEAGLPPGALNVLPGRGETVGQKLALHHDVDMIAFTGSTAVGKLMLQYAGQSNMKAVVTECGGKSPHIVFDDGVDLDAAAAEIAFMLLTNQGQICSVGSRLLVQRSIEKTLVAKIVAQFESVVFGNAEDPRTTFGPLASEAQCERVLSFIHGAPADGAERVIGGNRVLQDTGGYFVEPTIFSSVDPESRLAQEEIFGPVLAVIPFDDEADAVRIANATSYGLAAYIWSAGLARGMRMSKSIHASVFVHASASSGEGAGFAFSHEPFGQSGFGTEGGLAGVESYMRRHLVSFNYSE